MLVVVSFGIDENEIVVTVVCKVLLLVRSDGS